MTAETTPVCYYPPKNSLLACESAKKPSRYSYEAAHFKAHRHAVGMLSYAVLCVNTDGFLGFPLWCWK